jgi:hypothetical protein
MVANKLFRIGCTARILEVHPGRTDEPITLGESRCIHSGLRETPLSGKADLYPLEKGDPAILRGCRKAAAREITQLLNQVAKLNSIRTACQRIRLYWLTWRRSCCRFRKRKSKIYSA